MISFLICCTSEKEKEILIGEWYLTENPSMSIIFTADTLFIKSTFRTKHNWKIDDSNIFLKNSMNFESKRLIGKEYRSHFVYFLNDNNDTLRWSAKKDTTNTIYTFIRIKNRFEHFQKSIDFKIEVPTSKNFIESIDNNEMNPNYYVGLIDDKLMIKNDYQFINLISAYSDILQMKSYMEKSDFEKLRINLFTDRNVPEIKIDSIKNVLKKTPIKKIFRIYKNDTINYTDNLKWYGKFE